MGADPTERLYLACSAAIERCAAREREQDDSDTFADLGESLFWLVALAEAKGTHKADVLRALGWARDRLAHGVLLTAPTRWQYGSEMGRMIVGVSMLGTSSGHEWLTRAAIVTSRSQRRDPAGEAAYDQHLAGRKVLEVLRDGLATATA